MLAKLAARNVKRQIKNYVIYFITVSLTVALMFAMNNAIFDKTMLAKSVDIKELKTGLTVLTVLISVIVAFVLGYATSFMLKLRKHEFGTYLTLGMTRSNILCIFLTESLILCALSLITGLLLGLAFYQGIMAIVTNIMETEFVFAPYSAKGLLLTVASVVAVFVLSNLTSAVYLRRVSIFSLIRGARKTEKKVRCPAAWFALSAVSLAAVIYCCIAFNVELKKIIRTDASPLVPVLILFGFAAAMLLFHIGVSKSLFHVLLRSEKFKNSGANTFVLRQLSGKMSGNAVMAGMLALLISLAIIGANFSFAMKAFNNESLMRDYPFDISAEISTDNTSVTPDDADEIISGYAEIESKTAYSVYDSGERYLHGFTKWASDGYWDLTDSYITESDFNKICAKSGKDATDLKGGFMIAFNPAYENEIKSCDFSSAALNFGGAELRFNGFCQAPLISYNFFVAIVPDDAVIGMEKKTDGLIYDLKNDSFDAQGLYDALSYERASGNWTLRLCDFKIREYERVQLNANSAVFVISALYASFVFVFLAMAILALKTLSDAADNRRRYEILNKIGASEKTQCRALFAQIFAFFFLPFCLPLLTSIPAGAAFTTIMTLTGFAAANLKTAATTLTIALIITAVYALYFTATYLLAKRYVIARKTT